MKHEEIELELNMPYDELQNYLLNKYGGAEYDYFHTPECKSKNRKVTRTGEGLYCHHMDEDKGGNLGDPQKARMQPFEWQKKERLVYCNILEHLILHIKIAVLRQKKSLCTPSDIPLFFSTGGIFPICETLNDMFMNNGSEVPWQNRCFKEVRENYEDYIALIKLIMSYINANYSGKQTDKIFLVPGAKIQDPEGAYEMIRFLKKKNHLLLRSPSGKEVAINYSLISSQFLSYADMCNLIIRSLSSGHEIFYSTVYEDILKFANQELISNWQTMISVDYRGFGFVQYAGIKLDACYGSVNADEYIAQALPMYSETQINIDGKTPIFWTGVKIPKKAYQSFFIIRIETSFSIKDGMEPFIRYRKKDPLRGAFSLRLTQNQNLKDIGWTVLSTSDIYNPKDGKYYSQYKNSEGKIVDATVTLSLGKDDYLLFKKRYDIQYLKILDGCYFV